MVEFHGQKDNGPYRSSGQFPTKPATREQFAPLGWVFAFSAAILMGHFLPCNGHHCARSSNGMATQRQNATQEASRAAQLIWGHRAQSVYCRGEGTGDSCAQSYEGRSMLCDVQVESVGAVQLCCNVTNARDNEGCILRPPPSMLHVPD